jgi:hypothetical protein
MICEKKGVSTVLGTLIFIGILLTAVIPMQLVMKQADSLYVRKIKEVESADEERAKEDLRVTIYPNSLNSSELYIHIENRGEVPVTIVRVWFNDDYQTDNTFIKAMENKNTGPFPISPQNGTYYNIFVTTERGNTFHSITGSVYYSDGTWYTPALSISVFILNEQGQYKIWVKNETQHQVGYWESGGIVHDDVIQSFEVEESGIYHVIMKKKYSGEFKELAASPTTVEITWPDGPPLVYVYGDGNELKE